MAGVTATTATFSNRVTELLGVDIPIVQAPMGWIARSQLASAVSNAGAMGIIETSSGELDVIRDEVRKMRDLTDKPFGVNSRPSPRARPVHRGVRGRPGREVRDHVGHKPHEVHRGPQGGRPDRVPRGAEPGRRTGDRHGVPQPAHQPSAARLRTERTNALEFDTETNAMGLFGNAMDLYFGGDMEAAIALSDQVAGRIDEIRPVADIISECARDCLSTLADLAKRYPVA